MPPITVPTITVASDFDGAAADGKSYRNKFSGKYSHRVLTGFGHNCLRRPRRISLAPLSMPTSYDLSFSSRVMSGRPLFPHAARSKRAADSPGLCTRLTRQPQTQDFVPDPGPFLVELPGIENSILSQEAPASPSGSRCWRPADFLETRCRVECFACRDVFGVRLPEIDAPRPHGLCVVLLVERTKISPVGAEGLGVPLCG